MKTFRTVGSIGAKAGSRVARGVVVQFEGLDKLIAGFDNLSADMARELDIWANRSLYKIQRESQLETPVDTGTLLNSIYTSPKGLVRGFVSTNTDYAIFVHDGANGRRANPFMERGIKNSEEYMDKELDAVLTKLYEELFGE